MSEISSVRQLQWRLADSCGCSVNHPRPVLLLPDALQQLFHEFDVFLVNIVLHNPLHCIVDGVICFIRSAVACARCVRAPFCWNWRRPPYSESATLNIQWLTATEMTHCPASLCNSSNSEERTSLSAWTIAIRRTQAVHFSMDLSWSKCVSHHRKRFRMQK